MRGMHKNFLRRAHFDQAACVHYCDAMRYLGDDGEVEGDE